MVKFSFYLFIREVTEYLSFLAIKSVSKFILIQVYAKLNFQEAKQSMQ